VDREGKVAYSSGLGELDFRPLEFEAALRGVVNVPR